MKKTTYYVGGVTKDGAVISDALAYDRLGVILGDCTIVKGVGIWQGKSEPCYVVTRFDEVPPLPDVVRYLAAEICMELRQETVLVESSNTAVLVDADGEVL